MGHELGILKTSYLGKVLRILAHGTCSGYNHVGTDLYLGDHPCFLLSLSQGQFLFTRTTKRHGNPNTEPPSTRAQHTSGVTVLSISGTDTFQNI